VLTHAGGKIAVLQRPYRGKSTACAAAGCRLRCALGPRARDGPRRPVQRRGRVRRWLTEAGIIRTRGETGPAASSVGIRPLRRPESKKAAAEGFLVLGRSSCRVRSGLERRGAACPRRWGSAPSGGKAAGASRVCLGRRWWEWVAQGVA
jgi:hypothetical protein